MPTIAEGYYWIRASLNCETFPTCISNVICYGYVLSTRHKKKYSLFWVTHHLGVYERIDIYTVQRDLVGGRYLNHKSDYVILLRKKSFLYLFHIKKIKSYVNNKCFSRNECFFHSAFLYNIGNCVFIRRGTGWKPTIFSFNLIFWALIFVKTTMACI